MYFFFLKDNPTAFSPLGGPLCPHKKKKNLVNNPPHGIFAAGGQNAHTRLKKKKNLVNNPTGFLPLGRPRCPHKKKKIYDLRIIFPTASSPLGRLCPHKKKKTNDVRKLGNIRKVSKLHRMMA